MTCRAIDLYRQGVDEGPFWCVDCLVEIKAGKPTGSVNVAAYMLAGDSVCEVHARDRLRARIEQMAATRPWRRE